MLFDIIDRLRWKWKWRRLRRWRRNPITLSDEHLAQIESNTDDIVNQVWSLFIKRLPQLRPMPEDIIPQLPSLRDEYREYALRYYTKMVVGIGEVGGHTLDDVPEIIDFMYNQILDCQLYVLRMESSVLSALEDLMPDPNLRIFDADYRTLCTACAMRIADAEHNGVQPDFASEGETLAETVATERRILDELYELLQPRTRLLRQEEYENAVCIIDYMEGKTDLLPLDVLNKRSLFHTAWSR